jgi:hypothetical protein
MAFYEAFAVQRNEPDLTTLLRLLRVIEPTIGVLPQVGGYRLKKNTPWTETEKASAGTVLRTAPDASPQLSAQAEIDHLSIVLKALALVLLDEINILRTREGLPARTPAQAIQAIRNKCAEL